MTATPKHLPHSNEDALLKRIQQLERAVANLANKTLFSASVGAGGIAINDGGGITIGPGGEIVLPAGGKIFDGAGNIIFSADGTTGQRLSTPFLPVMMYPEFQNRTTANGFMTCLASDIGTTEKNLWEGAIPQVVAPLIMWKFVGGDASSSAITVTYRLYVNGTMVDSFSSNTTTVHQTSQFDALDITEITIFGTTNVPVVVTAQCSGTNADQIFAQMLGVAQCGR